MHPRHHTRAHNLSHGARTHVIDGPQNVFLAAASIAALALVLVVLLREVPLQGPGGPAAPASASPRAGAARPEPAGAAR